MSGVNAETRSVTVEWFERGETKGKEVEIDSILALNPELIGTRRSPHLQPVSNAPNKLARVSTPTTITKTAREKDRKIKEIDLFK